MSNRLSRMVICRQRKVSAKVQELSILSVAMVGTVSVSYSDITCPAWRQSLLYFILNNFTLVYYRSLGQTRVIYNGSSQYVLMKIEIINVVSLAVLYKSTHDTDSRLSFCLHSYFSRRWLMLHFCRLIYVATMISTSIYVLVIIDLAFLYLVYIF